MSSGKKIGLGIVGILILVGIAYGILDTNSDNPSETVDLANNVVKNEDTTKLSSLISDNLYSDIAVLNRGSNNVTILLSNGDGTFTPSSYSPVSVGKNPVSITIGNFNNDESADLAVANQLSNNTSILLGQGGGKFIVSEFLSPGGLPVSVASGNFFGRDAHTDLAIAHQDTNTVSIHSSNNDGTFSDVIVTPLDGDVYKIIAGLHLKNYYDNYTNLVVLFSAPSGGASVLMKSNTYSMTGSYFDIVSLDNDIISSSAVIGNFTANYKLLSDVVITDITNNQAILYVNVAEDPTNIFQTGTGEYPFSITVGNFTDDGRNDLVISGLDWPFILINDGDGRFTSLSNSDSFGIPDAHSVAVGNFNNDGITDLVFVDSNNLYIALGDGNGNFENTSQSPISVGTNSQHVVVGDFS